MSSKSRILRGCALKVLPELAAKSVQTCITSPPYWGLRDYGVKGQLGLERTPDEYVENMVEMFRQVRRVLRDDGTLWLNLGDSYNAYNGGAGPGSKLSRTQSRERPQLQTGYGIKCPALKPKDLVGIPWRVAFALQRDGWYLRSDIIWHKPNPMPESVTDRPTKAHEYLFLLTKSERYLYDHEAIKEPISAASMARYNYEFGGAKTKALIEANKGGIGRRTGLVGMRTPTRGQGYGAARGANGRSPDRDGRFVNATGMKNKRTVWSVVSRPYKGAHFATFPPALIEPCVLAGSRPGDLVLDPFNGAGTTGLVALKHGRRYLGVELNRAYIRLTEKRLAEAAA